MFRLRARTRKRHRALRAGGPRTDQVCGVSSIAELSDGRIATCGYRDFSVNFVNVAPAVHIFDPQGNLLFAGDVTAGGPSGYVKPTQRSAIKALPASDRLALDMEKTDNQGLIATVTDQAKVVWTLEPPGVRACNALAVRDNGDLEVWCTGFNVNGKFFDLVRVLASSAGKLISSDHFPTPGEVGGMGHGLDAAGNTYVATTVSPSGNAVRVQLFKFDAKGSLVWQRLVSVGDAPGTGPTAFGMAMLDAGPVVIGATSVGIDVQGWIAGVDNFGNLAWQRTLGGGGYDLFRAGTVIDNNLFLLGQTNSKGAGDFDEWLVRTDAWGQGPCNQSGGCAKLDAAACLDDLLCTADSCSGIDGCVHAAPTCDDGNPCTSDACDPKIGCKWTPLADGVAACADGGKCAMGYCP